LKNWLYTTQCLEQVEKAAIVRDQRKQQKLNAVLASSGSHIAVPEYQQVARLQSQKQPFSTAASARPQTGNRQVAPKPQCDVTITIAKQTQGRSQQSNAHNVIGPLIFPI